MEELKRQNEILHWIRTQQQNAWFCDDEYSALIAKEIQQILEKHYCVRPSYFLRRQEEKSDEKD